MFDIATYNQASSVAEAIELLKNNPEAIPFAGGTDILVRLHEKHPDYRHLVDIAGIAELKGISLDDDGALIIGALATFSEVQESPLIAAHLPVMAEMCATVAGPQIRNMATIGGNICHGAVSADSAAPLLVHNAVVMLQGPDGSREVALAEFYQGPGKVDLRQAEVMLGVKVAKPDYEGWTSSYFKYAARQAMDIATIGCAAAVRLEEGVIADCALAYTVAGPKPMRCPSAEAEARSQAPSEAVLKAVASTVLKDLSPRESWRAPKDFREHIIQTLSKRVLVWALDKQGVYL